MERLAPLALLIGAAAPAAAQTVYVVDDDGGPGVHFTSLSAAVQVAGPADRIEVRAGLYGATTIQAPVTVMGEPGVLVDRISVDGVRQRLPIVLADLSTTLEVIDTAAPVVLDCSSDPGAYETGAVTIEGSRSVWLHGLRFPCVRYAAAITVEDSTAFLEDVVARGCLSTAPSAYGAPAMVVALGAEVVLTRCDLMGGPGGCSKVMNVPAGEGGSGLLARDGSRVTLLDTDLRGGSPDFSGLCVNFASSGPAAQIQPATDALSTRAYPSAHGVVTIVPDFPRVDALGTPTVGATLDLTLTSDPGSSARLYFARYPFYRPTAGLRIGLGHSFGSGVSLGALPALGSQSSPFTIGGAARGALLCIQGSRTLGGGETELSNPLLRVVR